MEDEPNPGKYNSPRDAILDLIVNDGMADEQDGHEQASTGHFARLSIHASEIQDLVQMHGEAMVQEGLTDTELHTLVGHFIIRTDEQGFVQVAKFDTKEELMKRYRLLEQQYLRWDKEYRL